MAEAVEPAAPVPRAIKRPALSFPPKVKALIEAEYDKAASILEYGSGGSTVLAAGLAGKQVVSVESDRAWSKMMRAYFGENPPAASVDLIHVDIGPTKEWGKPVDRRKAHHWHRYPLAPWEGRGPNPDVVLIDGRFRVACFLTTLFQIRRPTKVLFDDYVGRDHYATVEEFALPAFFCERMAVFVLDPASLRRQVIAKYVPYFMDWR